jgi:hypothetical protein
LIHPVFHVSQLKKAVGPSVQVSSSLPPVTSALMVPERVLKHRLVNRGLHTVPQVLVKWSSASEDLATWEDREALRQRFPGAPAWRQADSSQSSSVRNWCLSRWRGKCLKLKDWAGEGVNGSRSQAVELLGPRG